MEATVVLKPFPNISKRKLIVGTNHRLVIGFLSSGNGSSIGRQGNIDARRW